MNQEKDSLLEKAYIQAQELEEKYDAATAYHYLLNIIYFRLHGEFKKEDF